MIAATKPNDATTADFSNHVRILLFRRSTSMSYRWFNVLVMGRARGAGSAGLGVLLEPGCEGGIVAGDDGLAGSVDAAGRPRIALRDGLGGAIANAVYKATGVRVREYQSPSTSHLRRRLVYERRSAISHDYKLRRSETKSMIF
jgi:hypothetical protein